MRILVVDDEPLARRRMQMLVQEVAPEATSLVLTSGVETGLAAIEKHGFDVILLDVRMRDGTGFDLLARLPEEAAPVIIFITAFGDTATRAFDAAATDYLLKPVVPARLRTALDRAQNLLRGREAEAALARLKALPIPQTEPANAAPDCFEREFWIRKAAGDFVRLETSAIDYASVEDDYIRLHAGERSFLLRESIKGLLSRIDPSQFVQTHRSTLVRASRIVRVEQGRLHSAAVVLDNGARLPLGRVHGRTIQKLIRDRRVG
jgi:DNA-binding LytR/AlgR family response regulator